MEFESLQAIWDAQNDKPVFSVNDPRLTVGLYQQRERSRRRLFRREFAPAYVYSLVMFAVAVFVFVIFFLKSYVLHLNPGDPLMSVWDGAALVATAGAALAIVGSLYAERRKHERTQNLFAPSLREELDRGIAQVDFELKLQSAPHVLRITSLVMVAAGLISLEVARLNGNWPPWSQVAVIALSTAFAVWLGLVGQQKKLERSLLPRKRALESMRAALDEDPR